MSMLMTVVLVSSPPSFFADAFSFPSATQLCTVSFHPK
jgi:hypothetical protein